MRKPSFRRSLVFLWATAVWLGWLAFPWLGELLQLTCGANRDSGPRRVIRVRNIVLAVLGAAVLVLKPAYHGPLEDLVAAHAGNFAVSFGLHFAAVSAVGRIGRPRLAAIVPTLLAVETFEATNGFGAMAHTYDRRDFIANAAGVAPAVIVDVATGRLLSRRSDQSPRPANAARPRARGGRLR